MHFTFFSCLCIFLYFAINAYSLAVIPKFKCVYKPELKGIKKKGFRTSKYFDINWKWEPCRNTTIITQVVKPNIVGTKEQLVRKKVVVLQGDQPRSFYMLNYQKSEYPLKPIFSDLLLKHTAGRLFIDSSNFSTQPTDHHIQMLMNPNQRNRLFVPLNTKDFKFLSIFRDTKLNVKGVYAIELLNLDKNNRIVDNYLLPTPAYIDPTLRFRAYFYFQTFSS